MYGFLAGNSPKYLAAAMFIKKKNYSVDKVDIDIALYLIHENSDVNQKGKAYFVGNKELVRIF